MTLIKRLLPTAILIPILLLCGCENYTESDEINGLINRNDLSLSFKVSDDSGSSVTTKRDETGEVYVEIDVTGEFSLRGEAPIEPGHIYQLSFILKNTGADPVICYSFWK